MVPADKVITCKQTDTIKSVMDLMLEHSIGAVVVPNSPDHPIGIITKTDIVQAYHDNVTLDHKAQEIMRTGLEVCDENMNRDQAAHILERNKVRYSEKGRFILFFLPEHTYVCPLYVFLHSESPCLGRR
jgi:CBS domain-containing protein